MPPRVASHAEFPESTASADGMRVIPGNPDGRNVFVHLGVEYAVKDGRHLHVIVIQPSVDESTAEPEEIAAEQFPLIAYVQGSGWQEQQLGAGLEPLAAFARRGYVVAIIEYRPSSVARFPAQIADAQTATRWLLEHAGDFHIDPQRVAMWGDSSGGHTTLMTALTTADPSFTDEPDSVPLDIACYVDFYGPTALDLMDAEPSTMDHNGPGSPETALLGAETLAAVPDLVRRADPRTHVSPDRPVPPILIAHGSKDRLVPFQQSVLIYDALREARLPVELVQVKGAGHGGPTFWTAELMDLVHDFLQRHLTQDQSRQGAAGQPSAGSGVANEAPTPPR
jgi:acetyl esterase/lipase